MMILLAIAAGCGASAPRGANKDANRATATGLAAPAEEPGYAMDELAHDGEGLRLAQAAPPTKEVPMGGEAVPADPAAPPPPPTKPDAVPQPEVKDPAVAAPLLIYTARLHMAVFEATKAIDAVQKLATDINGYLVRRTDRSIVIRVPAKKFRASLEQIKKLGDMLHREESVRDVTEEFYDLRVRIRNSRAMRDRLEQLLKEAKDVKEALMVEKELARVTSEIELMEGKLKLMRELISFSTITIEFRPQPTDQVDSTVRLPFRWMDTLGLTELLNL